MPSCHLWKSSAVPRLHSSKSSVTTSFLSCSAVYTNLFYAITLGYAWKERPQTNHTESERGKNWIHLSEGKPHSSIPLMCHLGVKIVENIVDTTLQESSVGFSENAKEVSDTLRKAMYSFSSSQKHWILLARQRAGAQVGWGVFKVCGFCARLSDIEHQPCSRRQNLSLHIFASADVKVMSEQWS